MRRSTRLAALAVGVLGLVATAAPPAQAITTGEIEFLADVRVIGGIGYPVLTLGPQVPTTDCLPLNPPEPDNCHPVYDHLRLVTAEHVECFNEVTNVDKLDKALAHTGGCSFFTIDTSKPDDEENTVTGHCGLSGGQVSVLFTDALGQDFLLDIHFTGVATDLVLDGHWVKLGPNPQTAGQHGLIVGDAVAAPVVVVGGPSCTNKTQVEFLVPGVATMVTNPTL